MTERDIVDVNSGLFAPAAKVERRFVLLHFVLSLVDPSLVTNIEAICISCGIICIVLVVFLVAVSTNRYS